jgi:MFS family permease
MLLDSDVNFNISLGQKWITILLAVEAALYLVFSPIFGIIADYTTARRTPYLVGLILLATSMALQTASHSVGMYISGRALQGASAAAVWVIGLALVVDTVDSNKVGEYFGYVSWAISLGALMGPILGGVVYDTGGYYVSE